MSLESKGTRTAGDRVSVWIDRLNRFPQLAKKLLNCFRSGDSTLRIWDVPSSVTNKAVEPTTCKHASGQRRSDVTAVQWNVRVD